MMVNMVKGSKSTCGENWDTLFIATSGLTDTNLYWSVTVRS